MPSRDMATKELKHERENIEKHQTEQTELDEGNLEKVRYRLGQWMDKEQAENVEM